MLLSARMLVSVKDVNSYREVSEVQGRAGSTIDVSLQLIDEETGRRFIPATGATLAVGIRSIDVHKRLVKSATNPFPDDRSIWRFSIDARDGIDAPVVPNGPITDWSLVIPPGTTFDINADIRDIGMVGTFSLMLTLTEGQVVTTGLVKRALCIYPQNQSV